MLVAFSPNNDRVASGGRDKTMRLWDVQTEKLLAWLPCSNTVRAIWFDPKSPNLLRVAEGDGLLLAPNVYELEVVGR